jgi:formylglycine-generating enzyme required for sulfatase activity
MLAPLVSWILAVVAVCAASVASASAQRISGVVVDRHPRCDLNVDAKTESGSPAKTLTLRLDGGLAFECLRIEPGRFVMGAPDSDKDALPEDKPQREVRIENAFYLGRTTVTFGQFQEFVLDTGYQTDAERDRRPNYRGGHGFNVDRNRFEGYFPQYTWRNPGWPQTKDQAQDYPVGNVSPNDAVKFCEWLSKKTGKQVRLPTEAEWEYACRAGTTTRFFTGDDPASLKGYANVPDEALRKKLGEHADPTVFFPFEDGYPFTAPVGSFKPNPWGLRDMLGNVFQWCADEIPGDPPKRILRGGSYNLNVQTCRCAARGFGKPWSRYSYTGFRIVVGP